MMILKEIKNERIYGKFLEEKQLWERNYFLYINVIKPQKLIIQSQNKNNKTIYKTYKKKSLVHNKRK